jgi:hypothetical protein
MSFINFNQKLNKLLLTLDNCNSFEAIYKISQSETGSNDDDTDNDSVANDDTEPKSRCGLNKTGCRGNAFHLFATLVNEYDPANLNFPNVDTLVQYIGNYSANDARPKNKHNCVGADNSVSLFTLFTKFSGFYSSIHTFLVICVDNNYKILQSWDSGYGSRFTLEQLSSKWLSKSENPIDTLNHFLETKNISDWIKLFGEETTGNLKEGASPRFTDFSCKCLYSPIHPSWFTQDEKKIDRPRRTGVNYRR